MACPGTDTASITVLPGLGEESAVLVTLPPACRIRSTPGTTMANDDGSWTIWFGPQPPEGREGNWVQTMPGKSYFAFMRLYGPLKPWFDKTWKPGDLRVAAE